MSEANKKAEPGSSRPYAAYRVAGEVFGRLCESLGFGELEMFTRTSAHSVVFQWTFKAGEGRYCCRENVTFVKLRTLRNVEAFADNLCDKWKHQHRKTTAESDDTKTTP